jgi:hypothetical protein
MIRRMNFVFKNDISMIDKKNANHRIKELEINGNLKIKRNKRNKINDKKNAFIFENTMIDKKNADHPTK